MRHSEFRQHHDMAERAYVLCDEGGNGSNRKVDRHYWLTPRPTGDFEFLFEWPEHGLDPERVPISVASVESAAGSVRELWPWTPPFPE